MKKVVLASMTAILFAAVPASVPYVPYPPTAVRAAEQQAPMYKSRAEIPDAYKWKLEHIYPNWSAWEADVKRVEGMAEAFVRHKGKLGMSEAALLKALDDYSALLRLHDKVVVYALMSRDVNTANPMLQEMAERAEKVSTHVREKTSWVEPEIVAIPEASIQRYLADDKLAPYRMMIMDALRIKQHTLSKEMEALLARSSVMAGAPQNIYRMLSKDVKFPAIRDDSGKEVQLTPANFAAFLHSNNRDVRKAAYQAYYQTLAKYQDSFAQTLSAKVKANNFYARARRYPSALEASLTPNHVPVQVYKDLIHTVNKHLPLLHRYMALKKKVLGVGQLHMYDLYSPIVAADTRYIPYEEAKQMVLAGLKPLGEEYGKVLAEGFNGGWVDVYSTDDKRSGAYHWGSYDTHPYVLLNYQGTLDDVYTIAHELGHAMHSYYTNRKQPYITSNYPIFTAEVASTLNETLMFKSMYAQAGTREEKLRLLNHYLETFRTTLFRQTQFAEFELRIHEREQAGQPLTAEFLKRLYRELNRKYYGPDVVSDELIAMEWARIPHFYYNFYVYQYATSFAASQALARQVLEEGQPAVERIREHLLAAGSSAPPIQVLKKTGVDMSSSKPIEDAMRMFEQTLNELETLVKGK